VAATPDAVVVGAGPNGLAAAILLASAGRRVVVYEASETVGGGCRSAELTLPGFVHDICSAVHPMAAASPFFRTLPLAAHGLEWIEPPAMLAHPLDNAAAALVERSIERTAAGLSGDDVNYQRLVGSVAAAWPMIDEEVLGPPRWPRHPLALASFGLKAIQSAERLASRAFTGVRARGLFAGIAAHALLPLDRFPTGAIALVLAAAAHTVGWVFPRGGSQRLANALAGHLESLGGTIVTRTPVSKIEELPKVAATLCDLSPHPFLRVAGRALPDWYRRKLERYRYGVAAYKVDWALDGPIPWRDQACATAGTVHIGGTLEEIAASERDAWNGRVSARPFILLSQPSLFDGARAPQGRHTVWGYCHVPHGSTANMLSRIEGRIERFAPGFRERVLARHVMTPADLERHNPNLVGGDIAAGVTDLRQLLARPTWSWYSTPVRGLYLCSAATPPGLGVHGMCGYFAAKRALAEVLRD
jgi:phytoene dehydrogenase-like protein